MRRNSRGHSRPARGSSLFSKAAHCRPFPSWLEARQVLSDLGPPPALTTPDLSHVSVILTTVESTTQLGCYCDGKSLALCAGVMVVEGKGRNQEEK